MITLNDSQRDYLNAYKVLPPKRCNPSLVTAQIENIDFLIKINHDDSMLEILKQIRADWESYLDSPAPKRERFNWDAFASENGITIPNVFETESFIVEEQIKILSGFVHSRDIPHFARNKVRDYHRQQKNIMSALKMDFGKTSAQKSKPIHAIQRKEKARAKSAEARRHNGKKG